MFNSHFFRFGLSGKKVNLSKYLHYICALIDKVLIFFSYSGPSGILGSDSKQNTA